jgi:copper chaperone CopZ
VTRALKTVTGVKSVSIDYPKRQANIVVEKSACVKRAYEAMAAALKKAGYGGSVIKVKKG